MNRLLYLIYNLLLVVVLTAGFPALLAYMYRRQGSFAGLGERLAFFSCGGGHQRNPMANDDSVIWFHGASVGEIRMLVPLIEAWRRYYPADRLLLTTMTITGRETAAGIFPEAEIRLLPFDLPWVWHRFFHCYRPRRMIIAETELWPNLLAAARAHHLPVALVNARLSEKSFRGYRRFAFFTRAMFMVPERVVVQDDFSRDYFVTLGVLPERIVSCGNIKFDLKPDPTLGDRYRDLFPCSARILVAGSTHPGEEEMILTAWERARKRAAGDFANVCLILAPRHPQRFDQVAAWLREKKVDFIRFSPLRKNTPELRLNDPPPILLLDTLGDLAAFYPLAAAALIGGTLIPGIGGHNPLEAAVWGRAVIHGPYTASFRDGFSLLDEEGGGLPVVDAAELEDLLIRFFEEPEMFTVAGRKAATAMARQQGAVECTMSALKAGCNLSS